MPNTLQGTHALYLDRDTSWLSFNERVLQEAAGKDVPLLEKIKFLSIYSSNLDEFYRVRVPALMALKKISGKKEIASKRNYKSTLKEINNTVYRQQQFFGALLHEQLLPKMEEEGIILLYNKPIPDEIIPEVANYFYSQLLAYFRPLQLVENTPFFVENNKLYLLATVINNNDKEQLYIVNIPSDEVPRFYTIFKNGVQYIVFIDDIIKLYSNEILQTGTVVDVYSFKITRDAALEFDDEYDESLAQRMEDKIAKRDFGIATRLLYDSKMPPQILENLISALKFKGANTMQGGCYHNLKDLASLPVHKAAIEYDKWPAVPCRIKAGSLLQEVAIKDIIINTPYQSYDTVLRFFNEAALHKDTAEIYVTLYRVANDSRIATALISAALNGIKVTVIVELKARFDETNNIRWSKKLHDAGVTIVHSVPSLKVHAKIALIKFKRSSKLPMLGLLATGNLNETTARFYTDHILLTARNEMLVELNNVFTFLTKKKKPEPADYYDFKHLLVAQFNLQDKFLQLIDREIAHVKAGLPAMIFIKLNNLEEKVLIDKLYEASAAGVTIKLLIRGICCLVGGVPGSSENITVIRIVDRYLEHGRIFIFHNNGNDDVYLGSADWMSRNIYRRIEVCFPVYDPAIKNELKRLINIQLSDDYPVIEDGIRSQQKIYNYFSGRD